MKGWMKPGDKAQESTGTAEHMWVLGGRYLKQDFKGTWAGQPFEGTGYTGYDNVRQEYQTMWLDNMATGMMQVSGSFEPGTKTLKQSGHFACPMTNEKALGTFGLENYQQRFQYLRQLFQRAGWPGI